ncbi:hypothetical protein ABGB07_03760 [Micromonosporaceae bacterium B7E4]
MKAEDICIEIQGHTTADVLDILGYAMTVLRDRGHELTPTEGHLRGSLADVSWLEPEGVWGTVYHTEEAAELASAETTELLIRAGARQLAEDLIAEKLASGELVRTEGGGLVKAGKSSQ